MRFAKAIVAASGAVLSVLTAAFADDIFSASEIGTVIAVLVEQGLTVWGVYQARNSGN